MVWIKCPNGVPTIVHNEAHIARLLAEGGMVIPDPSVEIVQETVTAPADVTQSAHAGEGKKVVRRAAARAKTVKE